MERLNNTVLSVVKTAKPWRFEYGYYFRAKFDEIRNREFRTDCSAGLNNHEFDFSCHAFRERQRVFEMLTLPQPLCSKVTTRKAKKKLFWHDASGRVEEKLKNEYFSNGTQISLVKVLKPWRHEIAFMKTEIGNGNSTAWGAIRPLIIRVII